MGPPADMAKALDYSSLANKSVLITGGASGLGALIAAECAKHHAHVTIADIKETEGKEYQQKLKSEGLEVNFVQTDVTDWTSQVAAFKSAIKYSHNSSIDVVVAVAGLFGAPFILPNEEPASLDHDPPPPPTAGPVFDVNIKGVYYTSKLAQHYFSLNPSESPERRALGVGATETFDLKDDREGGDGAPVVQHYLEREGKNYADFFHI
ncbi:hypothetical protein P7C71_g6446, partial [Lecanoromycetidae sp. Uapishka_2]